MVAAQAVMAATVAVEKEAGEVAMVAGGQVRAEAVKVTVAVARKAVENRAMVAAVNRATANEVAASLVGVQVGVVDHLVVVL